MAFVTTGWFFVYFLPEYSMEARCGGCRNADLFPLYAFGGGLANFRWLVEWLGLGCACVCVCFCAFPPRLSGGHRRLRFYPHFWPFFSLSLYLDGASNILFSVTLPDWYFFTPFLCAGDGVSAGVKCIVFIVCPASTAVFCGEESV